MIRRGYDALMLLAQKGKLPLERLQASLQKIAAFKALAQPPRPYDLTLFRQLADEIVQLNNKLNYTYGGSL